MKKIKIAYFGTPDFSVPTLELLHGHPQVEISYVVTMPDRPSGRGQKLKSPPVAEYAKNHKIPLIQTENINKDENAKTLLQKANLDCSIVLAFAQFLKEEILELPKLGCFNIHTSILPKYRGAAPIQYALLNGDKSTGVSIQKMVLKMDAGDIVHFNEISISPNENCALLYTRLKFLAALSTHEFIEKLLTYKLTYTPQVQDYEMESKLVSIAPTIKKSDGFINFNTSSFEEVKRKLKAFDPWPGIYCFLGKKRLKIFDLDIDPMKLSPGEHDFSQGTLIIGCKDCTLRLKLVQLEGKKVSSDTNLLNGLVNKLDELIINP